jgi:threonine synthase
MRYISTRGNMSSKAFSEVVLSGLASDGGLAIPESYPRISKSELEQWRNLNYPDLAFKIISKFVDDIPETDLRSITDRTYTPEAFHNDEITPLKTLEPGVHILSLSNGPTLAFKDIAMQFLGNLFEYVLEKSGKELNILGATSGDTGSSAEYAMKGKNGIRIFMLSPHKKMTAFQTAQMFSLRDPNIFNISIRGVFDDCQDIVKIVSNDSEFKEENHIGTVNSINWARIVAQIVYYFKGYFAATDSNNQQVSFAVPSGNFGNICAGHVAFMMGLPIKKLILATNENDVLHEFFSTGCYRPRTAEETSHTSSPSMDISKASNFERFIFDMTSRDAEEVSKLWKEVDNNRPFDISGTLLWEKIRKSHIISGTSNHKARIETIREMHSKYGVLVDPHTADGLKVGLNYREKNIPLICLETALPAKFSESIVEAIGSEPSRPDGYDNLEDLPQHFVEMDADAAEIKAFISSNI